MVQCVFDDRPATVSRGDGCSQMFTESPRDRRRTVQQPNSKLLLWTNCVEVISNEL